MDLDYHNKLLAHPTKCMCVMLGDVRRVVRPRAITPVCYGADVPAGGVHMPLDAYNRMLTKTNDVVGWCCGPCPEVRIASAGNVSSFCTLVVGRCRLIA